MLWSALLRGGSNKDHNKCLMANRVCSYMCKCWSHPVFFLEKKINKTKTVKIITASSNTAHIDGSGIRILGANRLNIITLTTAQRSQLVKQPLNE